MGNRYNRVTTEEKRDPKFTYTPQQFILSYGETALYLSVLGDPTHGFAPLDYVKVFFGSFLPHSLVPGKYLTDMFGK